MALAEFDLIRRYFASQAPSQPTTRLGIGDDCALLALPADCELALTTDTMVEQVHFLADVDPEALGHKLLAVNLSDLAAMGADPIAVTLALTMPRVDEVWLQAFASGFLSLAKRFDVDLIGGDTTAGPLTLTVQAMGCVPKGLALRRLGAKPGDRIFVTGKVGDAGLGLKIRQNKVLDEDAACLRRFERPEPRVDIGRALRGIATACIDVSDGLAADLGHILEQSDVGATLDWHALPLSEAVRRYCENTSDWRMPLIAGDDYELCFTVPPYYDGALPPDCHCIGQIDSRSGLRIRQAGQTHPLEVRGYEHFS
ncbi:MAG: hypothetical protein RL563_2601 [Pseudomonadota bacterium]|jgi:thiamine-monophosphate kinase